MVNSTASVLDHTLVLLHSANAQDDLGLLADAIELAYEAATLHYPALKSAPAGARFQRDRVARAAMEMRRRDMLAEAA